jgi:hypothetical protein
MSDLGTDASWNSAADGDPSPRRTSLPALPQEVARPPFAPPQRGWLLVVSGVLVLAQAVVWFAISLGGAIEQHSLTDVAQISCALIGLMIGWSQYNALVRKSVNGARVAIVGLSGATLFWGVVGLLNISHIHGNNGHLAVLVLGTWCIALQLGVALVANLRWHHRLTATLTSELRRGQRTFTMRDLFALVTASAIVSAIIGAMLHPR